MYSTCFQNEIR